MPELWSIACGVARVRVLALRALVLAGGSPTSEQMRRAVDPVLGDLVPLPGHITAADVERAVADAEGALTLRVVSGSELPAGMHPLAARPGDVGRLPEPTSRARRRVVASPAALRARSARTVDTSNAGRKEH